jgi:hypothetical protein
MVERIFTVVDGDPKIEPVAINLKPFKDLWEYDKTEDKNIYKRWLVYIWYMYNYKSPFFDSENKQEEVLLEVFGRRNYKIPRKVQLCEDEYLKRNTSTEQRTLDKAAELCDDIVRNITKANSDTKQFDDLIEDIEKQIKNTKDLDARIILMQTKMDLQEKSLDMAKKAADMIPRLEKQVQSIISLRKSVEKSYSDVENNKESIKNFIVDKFIASSELKDNID